MINRATETVTSGYESANASIATVYIVGDAAVTAAYIAADVVVAAGCTAAITVATAGLSAAITSKQDKGMANFSSLTVNNASVFTSLPSTANFSSLTVNNVAVLTSLPSSANFTSLTILTARLWVIDATTVATHNTDDRCYRCCDSLSWVIDAVATQSYTDAAFVNAKLYTSTALGNFITPAVLNNKTLTGNFSSLKVNDVVVLTDLPSTTSFITLTIGANAVATQSWVTSQSYLTAPPSTTSFTLLTMGANAVATQSYTDSNLAAAVTTMVNSLTVGSQPNRRCLSHSSTLHS